MLRSSDLELRDLANGRPELPSGGTPTGARLLQLIGVGGMSAVFLAEVDPRRLAPPLSPLCPGRIAVKILKPGLMAELEQEGRSGAILAEREATALGRIMERRPPTAFVVGFYGRGELGVEISGRVRRVPWLALEYVDGGPDGASLTERIYRGTPEGCDPVRALRLARGIIEGVAVLHDEGIIHRDLKPDNVLIVGPVGDETPKIADCGIARVEGVSTTVPAFTREYGASEQWLSRPGYRNPLIGPWTDVHALASVVWFLVGGEHWCRDAHDAAFITSGTRRSLRTASRLHPGFASERAALDLLDAVLARGASPAMPEEVMSRDAVKALAPRDAPPRYPSVDAFAAHLFPVLEDLAARWRARAAREGRASTAFRTTQILQEAVTVEPLAEVVDVPPVPSPDRPLPPLRPGNVAFQPDGKGMARFGGRLFYLWDKGALPIAVPPNEADMVAATTHLVRAPLGGFALVGQNHVRLMRRGRVLAIPPPMRAAGGLVGPIQAALGDGDLLAVVTSEIGDEGGPELWRLVNDDTWSEPLVLSLRGRVIALSSGPYGILAVGESDQGGRARAIFATEDGQTTPITAGLQDKPPLRVALCSAERLAWSAGDGVVLAFERGRATSEEVEAIDRPTAMGLDPVGIPWLITVSSVLRRSTRDGKPVWRALYRKEDAKPPLVGLGFTPDGVRIIDALGGGVVLRPPDLSGWQSTSSLLGVG